MNKDKILAILERAVDENGDIPMRLVRHAFEKFPEPCEDAVSRTELRHIFEGHCYPVHYDHNSVDMGMTISGIVEVLNIAPSVQPKLNLVNKIDRLLEEYRASQPSVTPKRGSK